MKTKYVNAILTVICCLLSVAASAQDGQLDMAFNPNDAGHGLGDGPDYDVYAIKQQPDGKVLLGGLFNYYNGQYHDHLVRINSDGTPDNTFQNSIFFNGPIYSIALQTDGKIILTGYFTYFGSTPCNYIARLNSNGTLDNTFVTGSGFNNVTYGSYVLPNGQTIPPGSCQTAHVIPAFTTPARIVMCIIPNCSAMDVYIYAAISPPHISLLTRPNA